MNRNYFLKRLIQIPIALLGITLLAYLLASMAPGSPLDMIADPDVTPEELAAYRARLGLDQPVMIQYFYWLKNLLSLNLGTSYRTSRPVLGMIGDCIGPTLILTLSSIALSLLIAVPLGIKAGLRPYSFWDHLASILTFGTMATPSFFFALILICIFAVRLRWFPTSGMYDNALDHSFASLVRHLILPMTVLGVMQTGDFVKQARGSVREVLQEDYIRTARAKGLRSGTVIRRHVLRNAISPVLTVLGMKLPFIFGGAVVTEQIFNWPGIGRLLVSSITSRDYPAIMGIVVLIATAVLIGSLLLDILYGILDPRISYQ